VCNDFGKNVDHLDLVEGHNTHGINFLSVLHLETRNKPLAEILHMFRSSD
jgi:hypothetical protein